MNKFLADRAAFLTHEYGTKYRGPVFRGQHPLPHQSQAIARDIEESDIQRGYATSYDCCVLSHVDASLYQSRAHSLPYNYFVHVHGLNHTAFFTHAQIKAWADAYGLEGDVPPIPEAGILTFELRPGRPMQPLRVDLSTGTAEPKTFALKLLES